MSDWDPEANEIYLRAVEAISAEARAEILDAACGSDTGLRARVESLLAAQAAAGSFLKSPPPGVAVAATQLLPGSGAHEPAAGERIGPYTLLQKLGEGGMGTVWAAEQQAPVRRRVALKLIKPGMDSVQVLRRFDAERQALALMDHTNIAKVFDAGTTPDGRPFFAMELVKGVPITKYCDELNLSIAERLELFLPVCQAIQHAHQKGIIHRDIKPSNVLVCIQDDRPMPKVIDFGVAKALHQRLADRTMYTEIGAVIGTLEYMAPEQAELSALDVDTRADVYALGALLYELLTGSTPLDRSRLASAGLAEVMRIIREEEPLKPSTRLSDLEESLPGLAAHRRTEPSRLTKELRGDLDWIVMKCLEKDRARRYETANGLARDIERHLADEPVEARPPSRSYRLKKLARRNKGLLAATALVVFALVIGTVVATWQAVRARKAEMLADDRFQNEQQARKDADVARNDAIRERKAAEVEAAKATAVSELLQEMLSSANPDQAKGAEYTVRQLLDDSSLRLQDQLQEQPEVEAAVRASIGNAYRRLGMTDKAEPHLARALALRRSAADRGSSASPQELLAQSLLDFGWNLYESGRYADAERHIRESTTIYRRLGNPAEPTLEALAVLVLTVNAQGKVEEAEEVAHEAIAFGRQQFPHGHAELANVLHRLASIKHAQGDLIAGESLAREAIPMHERWHGPEHLETAHGLNILAFIETDLGKYAAAEANLRRASPIFERLVGFNHNWSQLNRASLEKVVQAQGDPTALAKLKSDWSAKTTSELKRESIEAVLSLAEIHLHLETWDKARAYLDAASEGSEASIDQAERLANGYGRLADGLGKVGGRAADEAAARSEVVRWRERLLAFGSNPSRRGELALALAFYGFALEQSARPAEAAAALAKAVSLYDELLAEQPANLWNRFCRAFSGRRLATIFGGLGRVEEAIALARESVRLNDALVAEVPDRPEYLSDAASARRVLVGMLIDARRDRGEEFRDLLASARRELHDEVAHAYAERGRWVESAAAFRRALDLDQSDPFRWYRYASLCLELGDEVSYRAACREMLARFSDTSDLKVAEVTIKTCAMSPGAIEEFHLVTDLADRVTVMFEKDPYPWFMFAKALAAHRAGRQDEAAHWLERFTPHANYTHSRPMTFALLALVEQERGRPSEAYRALEQARAIVTLDATDQAQRLDHWSFQDWLYAKFLCREAEARLSEFAEEEVRRQERLVNGDPTPDRQDDLASAYLHLGRIYIIAGRFADAAAANREAIRLRPEDYRPHNNLGVSLANQGMLSEAATAYREAAALNPDVPFARDNLRRVLLARADVCVQDGRWADVADALDEFLVVEPAAHWQWFECAVARAAAGDSAAYDQHCRRMLNRFGDSQDSGVLERIVKASLLLPGRSHQELAVRVAERAIKESGDESSLLYAKFASSIGEYREGRYAAAITSSERVLLAKELFPPTRESSTLIKAMSLARLGRDEEARQTLAAGLTIAASDKAHWRDVVIWKLLRREALALMPVEAERPRPVMR